MLLRSSRNVLVIDQLANTDLHDVPAGGDSVWTSGDLTAQSGESLTIPCFYDQKYKDHVKYWCKGYYWNFCSTLARSDSNQTAGKVSISDDPTHLVFNVTMRNLHETDSDTYWCAVEIQGAADDGVYLQLTVMEGELLN
uniref:Immunoglobulin domain-containing protein n=1 Tax=Paramormyrops kingsleyae TaxID=1676925 RepID=A0A3B3RJ38_9TELE